MGLGGGVDAGGGGLDMGDGVGGVGEGEGTVLSRLITHFRQLATNYLPLSSICPSSDRRANVWRNHHWFGILSLVYAKFVALRVPTLKGRQRM